MTVDGRELGGGGYQTLPSRAKVTNGNHVTIDGRAVQGVNLNGREVKMYAGGTGGASSRPGAWQTAAGAGSTKPPMVDNYIDSHGFNAGLGNASHTKFPSVVETKPMQVLYAISFAKQLQ